MPDPINLAASAPYYLAALLFGYLLGSIPFGLLLTRLAGLGDVRSIGSGNIGATNVLRTGRKDIAAATLVADALKGTAAVLLAAQFGVATGVIAGVGALIGHCYPIWLKFKGGKGVATFLGVVAGMTWPHALLFAATWLATAALFRISSLAALVAALVVVIAAFIPAPPFGSPAFAEVALVMVALIFWKHRENIGRLRRGEESRIGSKASASAPPSEPSGGQS
ncbi:MAG: glycerol-3-phosphate 1-O-acyltransferase PlsY [Devosiaceae bacterium]|nr:glycerol-3-phosphate 1-O-acyltransferase PlsY [Devosiaceae bacterium MH13]